MLHTGMLPQALHVQYHSDPQCKGLTQMTCKLAQRLHSLYGLSEYCPGGEHKGEALYLSPPCIRTIVVCNQTRRSDAPE